MIQIIRARATKAQIDNMLQSLGVYIKLAVDVQLVEQLLGGV